MTGTRIRRIVIGSNCFVRNAASLFDNLALEYRFSLQQDVQLGFFVLLLKMCLVEKMEIRCLPIY